MSDEDGPDGNLYGVLNERIKHINTAMARIRKELYGNGAGGIKDEIVRLRLAVKIATYVAGVIIVLTIGDIFQRASSTPTSQIQKHLDEEGIQRLKTAAQQQKALSLILVELEKRRAK